MALLGDNPEGWLCPQAPQCSEEEPWVPGRGRTLRERGVQSSLKRCMHNFVCLQKFSKFIIKYYSYALNPTFYENQNNYVY